MEGWKEGRNERTKEGRKERKKKMSRGEGRKKKRLLEVVKEVEKGLILKKGTSV